jgi:hypothetical protein
VSIYSEELEAEVARLQAEVEKLQKVYDAAADVVAFSKYQPLRNPTMALSVRLEVLTTVVKEAAIGQDHVVRALDWQAAEVGRLTKLLAAATRIDVGTRITVVRPGNDTEWFAAGRPNMGPFATAAEALEAAGGSK